MAAPNDPILIDAVSVSKKFSADLKRSLWYGVQDIAGELMAWRADGHPALRRGEFWTLDDVSFQLRRGEALGLIGPNGAGKSTLLKILNGLIKPDAGQVTVRGRVGALIELGAGFTPILSGRENIYINAAMLGLSRRQTHEIVDEIVEFAGLHEFIEMPVQNYSSGMWARLGYAIAAHLKPDVLLVDEVLAVGDTAFRRKCLQHMHNYVREGGALVLVSHSMYELQSVCSRGVLLERGKVVFAGSAVEAVNRHLSHQNLAAEITGAPRAEQLSRDNPLVIEGVSIRPVVGEQLVSGQDAQVAVTYRSLEDIAPVLWAFMILTADLLICVSLVVPEAPPHTWRVQRGMGEFSCIIPRLPLNGGMYALRATIVDGETKAPFARFGWENAPAFFTVGTTAAQISNVQLAQGALVNLDVCWEE